jgi:hypothetical protein
MAMRMLSSIRAFEEVLQLKAIRGLHTHQKKRDGLRSIRPLFPSSVW